jgi:hypothetical protein
LRLQSRPWWLHSSSAPPSSDVGSISLGGADWPLPNTRLQLNGPHRQSIAA